jgi:hypothetical protein
MNLLRAFATGGGLMGINFPSTENTNRYKLYTPRYINSKMAITDAMNLMISMCF